jgi:hypothetical protein
LGGIRVGRWVEVGGGGVGGGMAWRVPMSTLITAGLKPREPATLTAQSPTLARDPFYTFDQI